MASGTKCNLDTYGEWKMASPWNELRVPDDPKLLDLEPLLKEFKPAQEWTCGVVCIAKVANFDGSWKMNVRAYDLPEELDTFVSDLFDISLSYNLVDVDSSRAFLYVKKSDDGSTNITEGVMDTIVKAVTKPIVTLIDEWRMGGWSNDALSVDFGGET
jgi:hypothetical protein